MPNYEIRDFDADGALVMVRIATAATRAEAEEQARRRLNAFATYAGGGQPLQAAQVSLSR